MASNSFVSGLLALTQLAACGGALAGGAEDGGTGDGGIVVHPDGSLPFDAGIVTPDASPPPGPFMEAPHPAPPQIQTYGGPVMTSMQVVPVFFGGDMMTQTQVENFLTQLSTSSYWGTTTSEYGVGKMTVAKSIVTSDAPPTTDNAAATWLRSMTNGSHPEWPAPDANTIYAVFLPDGASISFQGYASCKEFGGYHYETSATSGGPLIYAMLPRCPVFGSLKGIDALTASTSHELIEAATDPQDTSNPAYAIPDSDHYAWALMPGSEIGDMCAQQPQAFQQLVGTSYVQRTWSNASAAAGHDPCVPVLSEPYFNSALVLPDNVTIDFGGMGGQVQTQGVKVPVGMSKTIEVDLFSDGPTTPWTVQAEDTASFMGSADLSFSWDKTSGNNGDKLMLTITRLKNGQYNGTPFFVLSEKSFKNVNLWTGFASN